MPENTKEDSWDLLRDGDKNALLALYNQHYLGLVNFGIKLTGDRDFANDCITQLLIELWDKRTHLPVVKNVRCYLLTSLKHKIFFEIKSKQIRNSKLDAVQAFQNGEELPYEEMLIELQTNEVLKKKLNKAFAKLTPRQTQLLKMKFFEDADYDEIARVCNITRRTAYNIIHDSLKVLRNELYKIEEDCCIEINSATFLMIVITLLTG
ncbi:MAG: sigma-70 family RNA polymerase sigma factor [Ginsengibacter sp.]